MFFFEGKQELYSVLCLIVIPIISCVPFSFGKPKYSWYALLTNAIMFAAITYMFFPYFIHDLITGNLDSTTVYWILLFVPMQIAISAFFTTVLYSIKKRRNKKQEQNR